jgi:hypothetical protein
MTKNQPDIDVGSLVLYENTPRISAPVLGIVLKRIDLPLTETFVCIVLLTNGSKKKIHEFYLNRV